MTVLAALTGRSALTDPETGNSHGPTPRTDRMAVPGGMGSPALEDIMGIDDIVDKAKDFAGDAVDNTKEFVGDAVDNTKHFAGDLADKVKDTTHDIAEKIADATEDEAPAAPAAGTTPAP